MRRCALSNQDEKEYTAFPDVPWRNHLQEFFEVPIVVSALNLPKGVRMLEVGCGRGIALPALMRICEPNSLTGLDIDADLIAAAKKRMASRDLEVNLIHGDLRQMPFKDSSFDLVIDFGTCYHISNAEAGLHEIARVLSKGGSFVSETYMNQLLAHPVNSPNRKKVPWDAEFSLVIQRRVLLWSKRIKD